MSRNKKSDSEKIEKHHLSTIFDKVHELEKQIEDLKREIDALTNGDDTQTGKTKLLARIAENKAKVSSSHKACKILNTSLKKFTRTR